MTNVVPNNFGVDRAINRADMKGRSFELIASGGGWMFRTRPHYASIIKAAADTGEQEGGFSEIELAVLAAIAYHQPIARAALNDIFAREVSRDTQVCTTLDIAVWWQYLDQQIQVALSLKTGELLSRKMAY